MMSGSTINANNNKQLTMFMTLTKSLLSNDETKRLKRSNLSSKITSTIMNKNKFELYLTMSPKLNIEQQLNSIHCLICKRCIKLLQHRDNEIHIFGKTLFYKLTDNNDTLTNIMLVLIFSCYQNIMPQSLIILTNNQTQPQIYQEMDIVAKLRAITVIIDRTKYLFQRKNSLKTAYNHKMSTLEYSFNTLICYSLCATQSTSIDITQSRFSLEPYKLPSIDIQIILISFWKKYPLLRPNDTYFRTLYLLRWLCRIPNDFKQEYIITYLLDIITLNFTHILTNDASETVLTLYSLIGFLGGSSISICDNQTGNISINTYKLMQRIPDSLRDGLSKNLNQIIKNLGIQKLAIIISNMFLWPQTDGIYEWILDILQYLEKNAYFSVLTHLAVVYANRIVSQLKDVNDKNNLNGALIITKYLLYGLRSTSQAFHNVLPSLCTAIKTLQLLQNDTFFYGKLHDIVELCRVMLFIWPGHPSIYFNISQILHNKFEEISEHRIRAVLSKYQWKANMANMGKTDSVDSKLRTGNNSYDLSASSSYLSFRMRPSKRNTLTDKAGLTNLGATCYMNSIVQALYLSDEFRKHLLTLKALDYARNDKNNNVLVVNKDKWRKMKEITGELQHIFGHLKFTKREAVSTRKFVKLLPSPWTAGRQQDASEFCKFLLDCIWETIKHSTSTGINSTIDPFFGGLERNNIKCNKCNNISSKLESFTEIALSMTCTENNELCTLKLMDEHFGIEILKDENKYFCSNCNEKVEAQRHTEIVKPPKHLIICFKRFSWNYETMKRIKKNDWVNCPLTLDLPINENNDMDKKEDNDDMDIDSDSDDNGDKSVKYLLYSVVIHSGKSAEFGHYYTIGRHSKKATKLYQGNNNNNKDIWYMFNDRSVSISDYDKLCKVSRYYTNDVPYLLFYKRIDEKRKTTLINNNNEMKQQHEGEWEKKVQEDNKTFEKELAKFASTKSTLD